MNIAKLLRNVAGGSNGWKTAAKINCVILAIASVTLVGLSIAAASTKNLDIIFILSGNCDGSIISAVNVALHLLINILSTLVRDRLASSNFFMQILNAPSREELDNAHSKGSWLGIGVPSVRNSFLVSKFKTWCWIALLISSIPIHILFNAVIFETDYRDSDFRLTIATEEFVHNGPYFPPGASLFSGQEIHALGLLWNNRTYPASIRGNWGYGYSANDADTIQNLSKAATHGSNWTKIDSRKCWETYINCEDLKTYRDLVVVVDQPAGWVRRDMYCTNGCSTALGDQSGPSLTAPRISQNGRYYITDKYSLLPPILSSPEFPQNGKYSFFDRGFISLTNGTAPSSYGVWNISDLHRKEEFGGHNQRRPGLQPDSSRLSMKYCLAEALERTCHIALSPTLLLSVTAAIVAKTIVALILTVILSRRNQPPLVTLGDAVASFIETPDAVTAGFCTLNQSDFKKVLGSNNILLPGPRRWQARRERRFAAVPRSVWLSSYLLFIISISISVYYFNDGGGLISNFLPSDKNPPLSTGHDMTLTQAIFLANSPQLLLSICYLAYNNLFTRMQMAKEWATLATAYHPLRVTEPKGEQFATYRLQLPYKYSIPLIATTDPSLPPNTDVAVEFSESALLAVIVASIALISVPVLLGLKRIPAHSINSGSNSLALSAACHASTLVCKSRNVTEISEHVTEPLSPRPMVLPSSPLDAVRDGSGEEDGGYGINSNGSMVTTGTQIWADPEASELRFLSDSFASEQTTNELRSEREQIKRSLRKLAQSKIRWGVVEMPLEWYIEYSNDGPLEHLGFGAEEDMVSPPVSGNSYA
ncbi:hypothetical protein F5B21DRAFT_512771 [Xylaria acuta]|nr:hypothetical protein F5B21DRAFT_512771 [Xylaria acuta]